MSGPMIRVTAHDCQCSIKLLGHSARTIWCGIVSDPNDTTISRALE